MAVSETRAPPVLREARRFLDADSDPDLHVHANRDHFVDPKPPGNTGFGDSVADTDQHAHANAHPHADPDPYTVNHAITNEYVHAFAYRDRGADYHSRATVPELCVDHRH